MEKATSLVVAPQRMQRPATILHLLGIDHERLTVRHNGVNRRLTDVHGHVIKKVLA